METSQSRSDLPAHQQVSSTSVFSQAPQDGISSSAQEQTARERERLAFAQYVGGIGTFEWDIQRNEILWMPELEVLYGLPAGGFEGKYENWVQRVHPSDLKAAEESIQQAIQEGHEYDAEFRVIWPDGRMRWLHGKGRVIYDEGRIPRRMIGVNIDITERKVFEQQIAQHAALLRAAHDAFIIHEESSNLVRFWNKGATALYGWEEEEALGQPLDKLLYAHLPKPHEEIDQTLKTKNSWEGELVHSKHDGSRIVVASRWVRLELPDSRPATILQVNRDITEQRQALEHLHLLSEASRLLSSSLDYRSALIQTGQLVLASSAADWYSLDLFDEDQRLEHLVMTRQDKEEAAWYGAADLNKMAPAVASVLATQKAAFLDHISSDQLNAFASNEREQSWLRVHLPTSAIQVPLIVRGAVSGVITLLKGEKYRSYTSADLVMVEELASRIALAIDKARDYHDLQRLNVNLEEMVAQRTATLQQTMAVLQQTNEELERSNQELQDFAHVSSHDLQEPLRKIQAFGNLLEEEYGSALGDGRAYIERMRKAASRMQVLINDLLTFSRVTTKAHPFMSVNLSTIAQEVVDDLETLIGGTRGKVELAQLPTIEADPSQMRQMLQNLIGNALKFHRRGVPPVVQIYAEPATIVESQERGAEQAALRIFIKDNGIGFDEKYLDRIFTVFQRLHGKSEYEGTGIGLAVVRKIVSRHHGTITATSTVGQGSTFIVTLPLSQSVAEQSI